MKIEKKDRENKKNIKELTAGRSPEPPSYRFFHEPWSQKVHKIIYISIFTLCLVVLEYLLRDFLKYLNSFFNSYNKEDCKKYEYFEFYELSGRYFLLFVVYNLVNVYAALCFIFLDSFGVFINGLIRFIYLDPRPFWTDERFPPCFCAVDYGNPSTTGINLFILFATLYKCFTYNNKNKSRKIFLMTLGFIVIAYTSIIRVFQNIHFIHQLLYGFGIGYIMFYIFFDILDIDFDDEKQFSYFLEHPIGMFIVFSCLYLLSNLIHFMLNLEPRLEFVDIVSKSCVINPIFAFDNESYTKSPRIYEFLGYYYGVWLEYIIIFKSNYNLFTRYNLKSKYQTEKFNDTDWLRSIIRIVIMYLMHIIIVSKLILSKYYKPPEESMAYSVVVRLIIPYFLEGIFNFFILKTMMRHLRLTNEHIFRNELDVCDKEDRLLDKDEQLSL
jgi:membrane-associated phospholipid phosphatase